MAGLTFRTALAAQVTALSFGTLAQGVSPIGVAVRVVDLGPTIPVPQLSAMLGGRGQAIITWSNYTTGMVVTVDVIVAVSAAVIPGSIEVFNAEQNIFAGDVEFAGAIDVVAYPVNAAAFGLATSNTGAQNVAALNAAITAAVSRGVRAVYIPAGTYTLDLSVIPVGDDNTCLVVIPSDFTLFGDGAASVFYLTGLQGTAAGDAGRNAFGIAANAKNVVFEELHFVGQNGVDGAGFSKVLNNQSSCISFKPDNSQSFCAVRNCLFENLYGFLAHSGGTVRSCYFINNTGRWCANGVNINGFNNIQSYNLLYKCEGFECDGADNLFEGNELRDCFTAAFSIGGEQVAGIIYHGNAVVGNIINGMTDPTGQGNGIVFSNATCYGLISGNTIRACTGAGIAVGVTDLVGAVSYGSLIVGNVVINCSNGFPIVYGILLQGDNCVVTGNTVRNVPASTDGREAGLTFQIGIAVDGSNDTIVGNTIGGSNYCVSFGATSANNYLGPNNYVDFSIGQVAWNGSNTTFDQRVAPTAATILTANRVALEGQERVIDYADGKREYGGGSGVIDLTTERSAAGIFKVTGKAVATVGLGVGNSAAATGPVGSVVRKIQVFDASGNSLGYLAVYDAIT